MMSTLARATRAVVRVLPQTSCQSSSTLSTLSRTAIARPNNNFSTVRNFTKNHNTNVNLNGGGGSSSSNKSILQRRFFNNYRTEVVSEEQSMVRPPLSKGKILLAAGAGAGILLLGASGASLSAFKPDTVMSNVWPEAVRSRVHNTFACLGVGIASTAAASAIFFRMGLAERLASMGWMGIIASFGATVVTMMFTRSLPKDHPMKLVAWTAFNASVGLTLTPIALLGGALVLRAAAMTAAVVGSLSLVAANAPSDQFLTMAGPLSMGLGLVVVSSLGAALFPMAAAAPLLMNVSLYGGMVLFSGFVLYDTQVIINKAKSPMPYDPVGECISLYMDVINIFVRMVQILASGGNNRR